MSLGCPKWLTSPMQLLYWLHGMEELSDKEDYRDLRKVLSCHCYNALSKAFNNSKEKECLEKEFKTLMNQFIV
jgi:hypothetical protein